MTDIEILAAGDRHVFQPGAVILLGRGEDATLQLGDPLVGRQHATVAYDDASSTWRVTDLASRNGTWVAGQQISELAISGPTTVHLGGPDSGAIVQLTPIAEAQPIAPATTAPLLWAQPVTPEPVAPLLGAQPVTPEPVAPLLGAQPVTPEPVAPLLGAQPVSPAPAAPLQEAQPASPPMASPPLQPPLVVRLGGERHVFPVGQRVRIGRDPALELVTENPLITRSQHGVIETDRTGAYYTDTSARGTYLNGKPVKGTLHITESVVLYLGDPATGEELGITPPLAVETIAANTRRRGRRRTTQRGLLIAAAIVMVGGGVAGILLARSSGGAGPTGPSGNPSTLSASTLAHAESATVRLLQGSVANYTGWGSGTIISPNGLILTNGHVAEPQAPGEAVALGAPGSSLDPNPPYLTVELTVGPSSPAVATYRARPVAVDGYLDLAVVAIYASASGKSLNPVSLHLPYLQIGNISDAQLDEPVTVLGYPGVSDSDSISVTNGVISTFVPDPLGHVKDPRFELETTARVAHGNSGGAAIDNDGELIGVPSLTIQGEGVDISWRLRSVTEAAALIADAKSGTTYVSHILVGPATTERVTAIGFAASQQGACGGGGTVPAGSTDAYIGVQYSGFPNGIDAAFEIAPSGDAPITNQNGQLPQFLLTGGSGCETYQLSAQQLNESQLSGSYGIQLLAGPSLAAVGHIGTVSVGGNSGSTGAPGAAPTGASGPTGSTGPTGGT